MTDSLIQSCSDRVVQAMAAYNSIMEEVFGSMAASQPDNAKTRLHHGMARATAATAIEQLAACTPDSLVDLSVKQTALDSSKVFCADNPWLEQLINDSISRDLVRLSKPRKSVQGWFPQVKLPSWSSRPWAKSRAASDRV